jgi:hypothetical protein
MVIPGCVETDPTTARKHFFLKKEAKTFVHLVYVLRQRQCLTNKSVLVVFLKKERLPFFYLARLSRTQPPCPTTGLPGRRAA